MKDFMNLQDMIGDVGPDYGSGDEMSYAQELDWDGDGVFDSVMIMSDTDGDGVNDLSVTQIDLDGDGIVDMTFTEVDLDGDGIVDQSFMEHLADTDGDGIADSIMVEADLDGDTIFETSQIYDTDDFLFFGNDADVMNPPDGNASAGVAYDQFDAADTDMDAVVGKPDVDEQYWEYQGANGPCAIYAQVMAYEGLTGEDIDPREMIAVATEQGWYSGSGTSLEDMDKILDYLGAETQLEDNGGMDDLRECLENGGRIVAVVDGDEIWTGDNDDMFTPNDPNHAVEVIGIDYSGEEPMVILNDSGTPDGHAIMVSETQFVDAWEDSGFSYVTAYAV